MSEIYHRYMRGEPIMAPELNTPSGLRLYGEIIHFDWQREEAVKQATFDGDIQIRRVHPVEPPLTEAQEHLKRPSVLHNGTTRDFPSTEQRLIEVREQLERINLHGRG